MRKHGRRERACTSGWKRGRLKGSETCAEHKRPSGSSRGTGDDGGEPGIDEAAKNGARRIGGLDEKAVRRDKPRDVQDRRLFERTFLDENNGPRVHLSAPITTTMIIVTK